MKRSKNHFDLMLQALLLYELETISEVNLRAVRKWFKLSQNSLNLTREEYLQNQREKHSEKSTGTQSYQNGAMPSQKVNQTVGPTCSIYFGSSD
jgi:hypothetical protein